LWRSLKPGVTRYRDRYGVEVERPGLAYVLLHSLAHPLMEQIVLECGVRRIARDLKTGVGTACASRTNGRRASAGAARDEACKDVRVGSVSKRPINREAMLREGHSEHSVAVVDRKNVRDSCVPNYPDRSSPAHYSRL
jgi:hypothetical protein